MPKSTTIFTCTNCQFKVPRWQGRCPNCGNWNSFEEQKAPLGGKILGRIASAVNLEGIDEGRRPRIKTGISEFDEVVGGGIVPGSLILLGGDPGIGKSTLALQLAMNLKENIVYVSGEESINQIKLRAARINKTH